MTTQRKEPPKTSLVNLPEQSTLKGLLTQLEIPPQLQRKKRELKSFSFLTKAQLKNTLKNNMFFQEGSCRINESVWYRVYGNAISLYLCLFNKDNECTKAYLFRGWVHFELLKLLKKELKEILK